MSYYRHEGHSNGPLIVELENSPPRPALRDNNYRRDVNSSSFISGLSLEKIWSLKNSDIHQMGAEKFINIFRDAIREKRRQIDYLSESEFDFLRKSERKYEEFVAHYERCVKSYMEQKERTQHDYEQEVPRRMRDEDHHDNYAVARANTPLQNYYSSPHKVTNYNSNDREEYEEYQNRCSPIRRDRHDSSIGTISAYRREHRRQIPRHHGRGKRSLFKHNARLPSGYKALSEIRKYQRSTDLLIPRKPFFRAVRQITQELFPDSSYRFQSEAISALQEASEVHVTSYLENSSLLSRHAGRITLKVEDLRLFGRLMDNMNCK